MTKKKLAVTSKVAISKELRAFSDNKCKCTVNCAEKKHGDKTDF